MQLLSDIWGIPGWSSEQDSAVHDQPMTVTNARLVLAQQNRVPAVRTPCLSSSLYCTERKITKFIGRGVAHTQRHPARHKAAEKRIGVSDRQPLLPCAGCRVDVAGKRITVVTDTFGGFALIGKRSGANPPPAGKHLFLPVVVR